MENQIFYKGNKNLISKAIFFYIGLQLITVYIITMSFAGIWTLIFNEKRYTFMTYVASIPNILVSLFIPKIIKIFSVKVISYVNIVIQSLSCVAFILVLIATKYSIKKAYSLLITTVFVSSLLFSISQTAFFSLGAEFEQQTVQIYITGMASANLLFSVLMYVINKKNVFLQFKIVYGIGIAINLLSAFLLYWLYKNKGNIKYELQEKNSKIKITSEGSSKDDDKKSIFKYFKSVFMKKKFYILLNFFLFYETFLIYPSFMFYARSKIKNWGYVLMFLFGVFEVFSRALNTLNLKFIGKIVTKKTIGILCLVRYVVCIVPLITFLFSTGVFGMSNVKVNSFIDFLNAFFYSLTAFSLGLLGNNLAVFMYSGLKKKKEFQVAGSLLNMTIALAVFLGTLSAYLITKKVIKPLV